MARFTSEEAKRARALQGPRKKPSSRREKMARYAQTFARQRAEYSRHQHKRIGLPLVDKVEQGSMAAAVKLMCLDCSSWVKPEIRDCVIVACPLFPFRPPSLCGTRTAGQSLPRAPDAAQAGPWLPRVQVGHRRRTAGPSARQRRNASDRPAVAGGQAEPADTADRPRHPAPARDSAHTARPAADPGAFSRDAVLAVSLANTA
jgi:hypothetical protein